jgi:hypothetical protein
MLAQLVCALVLAQAAEPAKPRCTLPDGDGATMLRIALDGGMSRGRFDLQLYRQFQAAVEHHSQAHGWRRRGWSERHGCMDWFSPSRSVPCDSEWLDTLSRLELGPCALGGVEWILERAGRIEEARRLIDAARRTRAADAGVSDVELFGSLQLARFEKRQGRWKEALAQLEAPHLETYPPCLGVAEHLASIQEDRIECRLHLGTAGEWLEDDLVVPLTQKRLPACRLIELDLAQAEAQGGSRAMGKRVLEIESRLASRSGLSLDEVHHYVQRCCEHLALLRIPREELGRRIGEFPQNWCHLPELYEALHTDEDRLLPIWLDLARSLEHRDLKQLRSLLDVLAETGRPEVGSLLESFQDRGVPVLSDEIREFTLKDWAAAHASRRAILGDV